MKGRYIIMGIVLVLILGIGLMMFANLGGSSQSSLEGEARADIHDHAFDELAGAEPPHLSPVVIPEEFPKASRMDHEKITKIVVGEGSDISINVRSHSYNVVHTIDELKALENTLTYVLLPRNLSGHSNQNTAIYKRYVQVLELIQELKKVDTTLDANSSERLKENAFILFQNQEMVGNVTVENYNYALAHKVLDFFNDKYPPATFAQDGPYLITTAKNVLKKSEAFSFLYVNMSTFNNSSVKEVLESYKQRLIDRGNSDVGILESWRLILLSALTNFNADIHIFQTAVAGEL